MVKSNYKNRLSIKNRIGRALWNVCYIFLFRPFPGRIFNPWRKLVLKAFGAKLKGDVTVPNTTRIWAPWNLEMETAGFDGHINCYNVDKVILRPLAVVSQGAFLCTASHNIYSKNHELTTAPIVIEEKVWIGADAFVGMGVTIGQGAVVGARAAVFKDVEPWTIVGGNPARPIKKRVLRDG